MRASLFSSRLMRTRLTGNVYSSLCSASHYRKQLMLRNESQQSFERVIRKTKDAHD